MSHVLSERFETYPNAIATCANDFGLQDQQPVSQGNTVRVIWKQKKSLGGAKVHIANAVVLLLAGQQAGKTITGLTDNQKLLVPEGWLMVKLHPAEKQPDKQKLPAASVEAMQDADKGRHDKLPDGWKDRLPGAANMQTDLHYLYTKVSTRSRIRQYHMYVLIPLLLLTCIKRFPIGITGIGTYPKHARAWMKDVLPYCVVLTRSCVRIGNHA